MAVRKRRRAKTTPNVRPEIRGVSQGRVARAPAITTVKSR